MDQEKRDARATKELKLEEIRQKKIKVFNEWKYSLRQYLCCHCLKTNATKLMQTPISSIPFINSKWRYFCEDCSQRKEIKQEYSLLLFNRNNQSK